MTPPGDPGDPGPGGTISQIENMISYIPKIHTIVNTFPDKFFIYFPLILLFTIPIMIFIRNRGRIGIGIGLFFHGIIIKISCIIVSINNFFLNKMAIIILAKIIKTIFRIYSAHSGHLSLFSELIKYTILCGIVMHFFFKTMLFCFLPVQDVLVFCASSSSVFLDTFHMKLAYNLGQLFHFSKEPELIQSTNNLIFISFFDYSHSLIETLQNCAYFYHDNFLLHQHLNYLKHLSISFITHIKLSFTFKFSNMDCWEIISYTVDCMGNLDPTKLIEEKNLVDTQITNHENTFSPAEREKMKTITRYLRAMLDQTLIITVVATTVTVSVIMIVAGMK